MLLLVNLLLSFIFINSTSQALGDELQWIPGKAWVQKVQENYENKVYDPFLTQLHKRYIKGLGQGEWEIALRKTSSAHAPEWKTLGEKRKREDFQKQLQIYQKSSLLILQSTNRELEKIATNNPPLLISQIIQEYIDYKEDPVVSQLASDAVYSDKCERLFSDIAQEGEIKRNILYLSLTGLNEISVPMEKFEEYGLAIGLEEYAQMLAIAHENANFHKNLLKSFEQYLQLAAKNHNFAYLIALSQGKMPITSQVEVDVAELMQQFLESKRNLLKKYQWCIEIN
jgi:hypothetical protein